MDLIKSPFDAVQVKCWYIEISVCYHNAVARSMTLL